MSSSDRRAVLAGLAGALALTSGCFRPMLAESSAASALHGRIALPTIDGRFQYHLGQSLEDRLGTPRDPLYRLEVRTRLTEDNLAITPDDAITRKSLTAEARFRLLPVGSGEPVMTDRVISQSGYNSTGSLFATRVAAQDTEKRLAQDLGERIARRILADAGRLAPS